MFFLYCSSCSPRPEMNIPQEFFNNPDTHDIVDGTSLVEARMNIKKSILQCTGTCSESVALLAGVFIGENADPNKRFYVDDFCTVSFVKLKGTATPDKLYGLTAGHCIPERLSQGASCSEDIAITTAGGRRVNCEKIEFISADRTVAKNISESREAIFDVALLSLTDTTGLSGFDLNTVGLKTPGPSHIVKMIAIDPDPNWLETNKASYRETECWYQQNSFVFPKSRSPNSPLFALGHCKVRPGNSGAPILDGGVVVGVESQKQPFFEPHPLADVVGLASNISCFNAKANKLICESSLEKLFVENDNSTSGLILHSDYLHFVLSLAQDEKTRSTFSKATQKVFKLLREQESYYGGGKAKSINGFSKDWDFADVKLDNSKHARIPFPRCYSKQIGDGELGSQRLQAVFYSLDDSSLELSIAGYRQEMDVEIFHVGNGVFKLKTFTSPSGYVLVKRKSCIKS